MLLRPNAIDPSNTACQWVNLREALHRFGTYAETTTSQAHIKPLHWYAACRLVLEGGFDPEEITPRPPFERYEHRGLPYLRFAPELAGRGESTILGGLKTKNVDVVVTKKGIGPVLAISCKGMTVAFRNLTNRMEETIGECTNLHITYPALVFGYMFVLRANEREVGIVSELPLENAPAARQLKENDIAITEGGMPVESIIRFHSALSEITGRRGIRDDGSRYEAVTLALVRPKGERAGEVLETFPPVDSKLWFDNFFRTLYLRYEERFVFGAPDLKPITRRIKWAPGSPVFSGTFNLTHTPPILDFDPRLSDDT